MSYALQAFEAVLGPIADVLHAAAMFLRKCQIGALRRACEHERATARRLRGQIEP